MAIVSMKRLRLIGLLEDRDSLFTRLQALGCLEITEPEMPEEEALRGIVHPNESTRSEKASFPLLA